MFLSISMFLWSSHCLEDFLRILRASCLSYGSARPTFPLHLGRCSYCKQNKTVCLNSYDLFEAMTNKHLFPAIMTPSWHCDIQLMRIPVKKQVLRNTCKPDMHCALVGKCTCARVMREHWGQKHRLSHFQSIMPCFPEHLFSLDFIYYKALQADIFRSCSIKNQGLSRTKNEIQVLSRP